MSFAIAIAGLVLMSQRPAAATDSAKPAVPFDLVRETPRFTIGKVGFAGHPSKVETSFREILSESNAKIQLNRILSTGTKAGQLYALLGLKILKDPQFKQALPHFLSDKSDVETMEGCVVRHTTVKAIAGQISNGDIK